MPNQPYKPTFGSGVQQYQMDNVGKGARQRPPYAPGAANPGQQVNMALPNSAVIKSMMPQPQGFGPGSAGPPVMSPIKAPWNPLLNKPIAPPQGGGGQGQQQSGGGQQSTNQWEQKASNLWGQQTAMDPNVWNKKAAEMRAQIGSDYANQRYQLAQQSAASGGGFSGQGLTKAGFLAQGEATAKAVATNQLALEQAKLGLQEKMQMLQAAYQFADLDQKGMYQDEMLKVQQDYLELAQQGQIEDQYMARLDMARNMFEQKIKPGSPEWLALEQYVHERMGQASIDAGTGQHYGTMFQNPGWEPGGQIPQFTYYDQTTGQYFEVQALPGGGYGVDFGNGIVRVA